MSKVKYVLSIMCHLKRRQIGWKFILRLYVKLIDKLFFWLSFNIYATLSFPIISIAKHFLDSDKYTFIHNVLIY